VDRGIGGGEEDIVGSVKRWNYLCTVDFGNIQLWLERNSSFCCEAEVTDKIALHNLIAVITVTFPRVTFRQAFVQAFG
jgi:hypothetical protein